MNVDVGGVENIVLVDFAAVLENRFGEILLGWSFIGGIELDPEVGIRVVRIMIG